MRKRAIKKTLILCLIPLAIASCNYVSPIKELENLLGKEFPDPLTTEELKEILRDIHDEKITEEKAIELVKDVMKPDESLKEIFEENFRGRIKVIKGIVFLTDGSTATNTGSYTPISSLGVFSQNEGDILLVPVIKYKAKEMLDIPMDQDQVKELNRGAVGTLTDNNGNFFNSVIAPGLDPKSSNYLDYELIGFTSPKTAGVDADTFSFDDKAVEEISGDDPEYIRDDEGNIVAVEQGFSGSENLDDIFANPENTINNQNAEDENNFEGEGPKFVVRESEGIPFAWKDNGPVSVRMEYKRSEDSEVYDIGRLSIPGARPGPDELNKKIRDQYHFADRMAHSYIAHQ